MDDTEGNRTLSFDWLGFAAFGIAIGAFQLMLDRGEQLGWFDSGEIVLLAIVSGAAFYFFIAHSLTTERPFIPIEIFRDRNFIVGLTFMFVTGILLVASMALMAPLLQGVMGYPILDAGLLLGNAAASAWRSTMLMAGPLMAPRRRTHPALPGPAVLCRLALLLDRLHARHDHAHHRVDQHPAGRGARLHVRAAEHHLAGDHPSRRCARKARPCGR